MRMFHTKTLLFVFSSNTFIRGFPDSIMNQPIIRMENRLAVFFTIHILSIQFRLCFGAYQYWMSEPMLPKYILYHACIDSEAGFANAIFLFWLIRFRDALACWFFYPIPRFETQPGEKFVFGSEIDILRVSFLFWNVLVLPIRFVCGE